VKGLILEDEFSFILLPSGTMKRGIMYPKWILEWRYAFCRR